MLLIYARLGVNISLASVSGIEKNIPTQKWLNLLYLPWNVLNERDPGKESNCIEIIIKGVSF